MRRIVSTASALVLVFAALIGCRANDPTPAADETVAAAARVELRIDGMT